MTRRFLYLGSWRTSTYSCWYEEGDRSLYDIKYLVGYENNINLKKILSNGLNNLAWLEKTFL